jgi:hypothetical protein
VSDDPHGIINRRLFMIGLVLIIVMAGYFRWPAHPQTVPPGMVRIVQPLPTLMPTATPFLLVPTPMPVAAPPPVVMSYDGGNTTNVNVNVNVCVGLCR